MLKYGKTVCKIHDITGSYSFLKSLLSSDTGPCVRHHTLTEINNLIDFASSLQVHRQPTVSVNCKTKKCTNICCYIVTACNCI